MTVEPHIPFALSGFYPVRAGNLVRPLIDGEPAFRRICEAVEAARHSDIPASPLQINSPHSRSAAGADAPGDKPEETNVFPDIRAPMSGVRYMPAAPRTSPRR